VVRVQEASGGEGELVIIFLGIVLGYVALTVACWFRAFSEAQRALPVVWSLKDWFEPEPDQERAARVALGGMPSYHAAQAAAAVDPDLARWLALGGVFYFAVTRPFFVFTWTFSKRCRREFVCRLTVLAAMVEYEWEQEDEAAILTSLAAAQHELMHMLEATDRLTGRR